MDARDRRYIKEARERAKSYAEIKRGYATPAEKKAFRIAEGLRRADWADSLAALDADERRARLRAFRAFKAAVFFASLFGKRRAKRAEPDTAENTPAAPEDEHLYTNMRGERHEQQAEIRISH